MAINNAQQQWWVNGYNGQWPVDADPIYYLMKITINWSAYGNYLIVDQLFDTWLMARNVQLYFFNQLLFDQLLFGWLKTDHPKICGLVAGLVYITLMPMNNEYQSRYDLSTK